MLKEMMSAISCVIHCPANELIEEIVLIIENTDSKSLKNIRFDPIDVVNEVKELYWNQL